MTKLLNITKHVCGKCNLSFGDEKAYLEHLCEKTGFRPNDHRHFEGENADTPTEPTKDVKMVRLNEKEILASIKEARNNK